MSEHDVTFDAMGSHVRFLIGEPGEGMAPAPEAAARAREFDRRVRRGALALQARQRAVRAERRPARARAGLGAAAPRGEGGARGGRAQRRPRRPDPGAGDRGGGLRRPRAPGCRGAPLGGRPRGRAAAPAGPPRPRGALARHRGRRRARRGRPPARASASTPAAPARASPPTSSPSACAATRASSSTAAATSGSAAPTRCVHPYEVYVEHPLTGERAFVLRLGSRRRRDLGPQRADLARRGRPLRAPPARPGDAASRPGPGWSARPRSATPRSRRRRSPRRRCSRGPEGGARGARRAGRA